VPCVCNLFLVVARSVTRIYNEELRSSGLEVTQHAMLMVLDAVGPMPVGDLGQRIAVDKTTVSRNVQVLVRNGWVELERGAADAREKIVRITKDGARTLANARPAWNRAQQRLRDALPEGEFEQLRKRLPEIAINALAA
jgi:DNA-binding MarR family transcriptional regulator